MASFSRELRQGIQPRDLHRTWIALLSRDGNDDYKGEVKLMLWWILLFQVQKKEQLTDS